MSKDEEVRTVAEDPVQPSDEQEKYQVISPFRHSGRMRDAGTNLMLSQAMGELLARDGLVVKV